MRVSLQSVVALCLIMLASAVQARPAIAQDIDFRFIYDFARRSAIAYDTPKEIRYAYPDARRIAVPGGKDVLYFLEVDHDRRRQVVTVRGTVNQHNMSEDMDTHEAFDRTLGVRVHRGFDRVAGALYSDMRPHLRAGYATWLTGHSLGGAVAGVLAGYLLHDGHDIDGVVTFGQPKFTNLDGVQAYRSVAMLRIVYQNDVVPMLPSSNSDPKHGAYAHAGPEVIVLQGPYYSYLDAHDATRLSVKEFERYMGAASLPDHHIHYYLTGVQAKLNGARRVPFSQRRKHIVRHRPVGTYNPARDHR